MLKKNPDFSLIQGNILDNFIIDHREKREEFIDSLVSASIPQSPFKYV